MAEKSGMQKKEKFGWNFDVCERITKYYVVGISTGVW
jgi:hypothetical protein